jgi:uncharacterized membrane protein (UPF0127 family)
VTRLRIAGAALAAAALLLSIGCKADGGASANASAAVTLLPVTITSVNGAHVFTVEVARTEDEQKNGLMYRTDIPKNGGMLFAPYPAVGPSPQVASFWMKNTPSALDILFVRPDGTIAHIAENTVPFSTTPVDSGEPVSAVLEILGGRAADLGISEGDKVSWAGQAKP